MAARRRRILANVAAGGLSLYASLTAEAAEYTFSIYGLGGTAFGAGVTPPPGTYVSAAATFYRGDITGNIAATVVVRVDPVPVYGNDPGKPAFGVIVAVIDAGSLPIADAATPPYFFRHTTAPRHTPQTQLVSLVVPDLYASALMAEVRSVVSVLQPAALSVAAGSRRYSFYSPESNLIAETVLATGNIPHLRRSPPPRRGRSWEDLGKFLQRDPGLTRVSW